ncbi:MAG: amino acid adenylation domain-containing protein, partial [Lysobacter sp.]|nr:amino acid adenylation domain-containing protein [Lysobacter sp.]
MYASGDLCRFNRDGNLEFVGRIDDQVKLRGHRIEPGEIEHALAGIDGVVQGACLVAELRGVPRLLAYCVLRPGARFDPAVLREQLAQKLPDYMLPDFWVALDTLPQTANGKVDRKRLPLPVMEVNEDLPAADLDQAQRMFLDWYGAVTGLVIGWEQDFVRAGGNSIDAILLLQSLHREHGLRLDHASFVRESSPASLYARIAGGAGAERPVSSMRIMPRPPHAATLVPASVPQRAVWFLASLAPEDRAYHAKARLLFRGDLCLRTLCDSLQDIVDRHEIFRTSFVEGDGNVVQRIHPTFPIEVPEIDLRGELAADASDEQIGAELDRLLLGGLNRPFALDRLPLVRWALVQLPRHGLALLHIEHHLVHDGWSHNLFVRELLAHYARRLAIADSACTDAPPLQYADFSIAQAEWLDSPDAATSEAYWRGQLCGAPAVIALPTNGDPGAADGMTLRRHFDRARWRRIEAACREHGHTPFAFVLSAFSYVLARASGDDDICIGSAFANRSWEGAGGIIGMMISTVVLRMRMGEEDRVRDLLANSMSVCTEAQMHQAFPFESLVRALNPSREPGTNPLFQVFLGFHDSPLPSLRLPGVESLMLKEAVDSSAAKFDLSLVVIPRQGQEGGNDPVHMLWEFKRWRFAPWFVETLIETFESVVDAFLDSPECSLHETPIGAAAQPRAPQPLLLAAGANSTVATRILDVAARQPEAVAIIFDGHEQRYGELAASLLAKAALLRAQGVGSGDRVAVCLDRSPELVAWLLAVQWLGAAYVPLDPAYPAERLRYIVEHSQPRKLLADDDHPGFANSGLLMKPGADLRGGTLKSGPAAINFDSPAYVIYTSGSTGRPKGVVVGHDNLSSLMAAMEAMFPMEPGARWLAITSCAFDISIVELFLPLLRGATVVLASEDDARDAGRLAALLARSGATHLQATPSTWRALVDTDWNAPAGFVGLCGGEALDAALARQCLARGVHLYNLYGPTETTIYSCAHEVTAADEPVPIGLPLVNTEAFVLDRRRRQLPRGAIGELWLGGGGVSRGYLHAPELTTERFVEHPFGGSGRLYATGDLVSADPEGRLYFHGRNDSQIKISGFRIELGEIEATIRDFAGVSETAV